MDLVYRDPTSGEWVVADYKTDAVASDADVERLVREYAPQGAVYTQALRSALSLPALPRFELWLLAADRIVAADPAVHSRDHVF